MADQLGLFGGDDEPNEDRPGLWQSHGQAFESQLAAWRAMPATGTWRRKVLRMIEDRGAFGATDEEMQEALGLNPSTQRPRRVELKRGGWIVDSGNRRLTRSCNWAVVWVLARPTSS